MTDSHDGALCARLGHYVAGIHVSYCPHLDAHIAIIRAGDEADDSQWRSRRIDFGPFDQIADVERELIAELRRLLRSDRSAWVARQREE